MEEPRKFLFVATVRSHIGQFHMPLIRALKAEGHTVHAAYRDNSADKKGLDLSAIDRVFEVPFERSPYKPGNLLAYRKLKAILDKGDYDIIHCHTPMGAVITRLAAGRARKRGAKVFYTAHGFHFYQGASKKNWLTYYPVERMLARRTDKLITINEEDFLLADTRFACKAERIHGVGVDTSRYFTVSAEEAAALKIQYGFSEEDRLILCVGELLPNKNQKQIIRSMPAIIREVPTAKLLLAGNGSNRENLEALVTELGLEEHVTFLGYCTVLQDYQRFVDVGVSCSIREGLGVNLIEAMLNRNPVVGTRNRGHNELIREGENGYLVDVGDTDSLAQAVICLLLDPALRQKLGERGSEIAQGYSVTRVKDELKEIYFGHD